MMAELADCYPDAIRAAFPGPVNVARRSQHERFAADAPAFLLGG